MSKLDDIFTGYSKYVKNTQGLYSYATEKKLSKKQAKQQIKDLMLELVGPDAISNEFWQHEFNAGYNHAVKGIRQRVEKQ